MKKLPYQHCFVVVQINNSIEKIFFDEVINYYRYSNFDLDENEIFMGRLAITDDYYADKLFMLLVQSYLNAKFVISEFDNFDKNRKNNIKNSCIALIFDIHVEEDDSGSIQIQTNAFDDKKDAFNYIEKYASFSTMEKFVDGLDFDKQNILFDI